MFKCCNDDLVLGVNALNTRRKPRRESLDNYNSCHPGCAPPLHQPYPGKIFHWSLHIGTWTWEPIQGNVRAQETNVPWSQQFLTEECAVTYRGNRGAEVHTLGGVTFI